MTSVAESEAFELVVSSGFYRHASAEVATRALAHLLDTLDASGWQPDARFAMRSYVFCRICQTYPEAHVAFAELARVRDGQAGAFVQGILASCDARSFPVATGLRINEPGDLDFLWAEFLVTGDREIVRKIVAVLDGPDLVRAGLTTWVRQSSLLGDGVRRGVAESLNGMGLGVDLERREVTATGDLDCVVCELVRAEFPVFQRLPFKLGEPELLALCVKGAALWSLQLNGIHHPRVREVCSEEQKKAGGSARALLTITPASTRPFSLLGGLLMGGFMMAAA